MASRSIDYTRFGPNGDPTADAGSQDHAWWLKEEDEIADSVSSVLELLKDAQAARVQQAVISARLYGNAAVAGMFGKDPSKMSAGILHDRISYNVVQSVVDTVTSKITKNRPRPLFLTSGGDYRKIRRAKRLNKFMDGVFYENDFHRLAAEAFRDSCVLDGGVIHVFARDGKVCYERVLSPELIVDEKEAFYGKPRNMHRVKNVDRRVLIAQFPDLEEKLTQIAKATAEGSTAQTVSDLITVRESWHLRSGPKAKDGRHVITVDGVTLTPKEEQDYDADRFPFAILPWSKRLTGIWGQSLAEQVQNIQLEINKLLWVIQRSMHLAGSFKIFLENSSKVVNEHFNNDIGTVVRYTGTKPEYAVPQIIPPEIYQHLITLKQAAFEQAGVSMLSAAAKKPDGLNSGKALREFNDIESERFMTVGKSYEQFALDVTGLTLDVVRRDLSGKYQVRVPSKKKVDVLKWADVAMDESDYVTQCFPVSSLPNDPAGRLQTIQEYVQAGWITQRQARRLSDFPDLEADENLANAEEEYLRGVMDKIVEDGEYAPPEPLDDLSLAAELCLETYALGKTQGLEEDRLEMLRRFLGQVQALQNAQAPRAQPALPAGPGGVPQASPMPAPPSDLLPMAA